MNNNQITPKQASTMLVMFIIGSSSLMVTGLRAKMDIWIAIILAMAVGALVMLIYARLLSVLPDKDFFAMLEHFLGKAGSKIALIFVTWFAFDSCALTLRNYGQFITTAGLTETPLVITMTIMMVVCLTSVRSGIEVIGRWSNGFFLYLLGFILLSVLLASQNFNISNMLPVLNQGIIPIAEGTLGVLTFPFAQTVVFLLVFPAFKKGISIKKVYLKGLLIGGLAILITSVTDLLVLGTSTAENMAYPTYSTLATVNYGDFLSRFEILAAIVFMIGVFVKLSITLFGVSKGVAKIFGLNDHRALAIPVMFLIINLALSFEGMIYFYEWTSKVSPYYSGVFEILIPLILLIIIEIKRTNNKGRVRA